MAKLVKIESTAEMAFTPPVGYITSTIGTDEEGLITELIKKSDGTITSIGGGGGSSDGYVAVEVDGVLKAQKLAFDGTEASPDGSAEEIGSVGIFNTGMEEPAYKGSGENIDFESFNLPETITQNDIVAFYSQNSDNILNDISGNRHTLIPTTGSVNSDNTISGLFEASFENTINCGSFCSFFLVCDLASDVGTTQQFIFRPNIGFPCIGFWDDGNLYLNSNVGFSGYRGFRDYTSFLGQKISLCATFGYNTETTKVYLNGVERDTDSRGTTLGLNNFRIGVNSFVFRELIIFNRVLEEQEIIALDSRRNSLN